MSKKQLTHEEFLQRVSIINPDIEILGIYTKGKEKISCKCKKCNNEWDVRASHLLEGHGCKNCNKYVPPTKSHQQFIDEVYQVLPNVKILDNYSGIRNKVECECLVCNRRWKAWPSHLIEGDGCAVCNNYGKTIKDQQKFILDLYNKHPEVECIEEYKGVNVVIRFKCVICSYEWEEKPRIIMNRQFGCAKCRKNSHQKDKYNELVEKMKIVNPYVEIIGAYEYANKDINCKCKICGHIWSATPGNLYSGKGCPLCNLSHGERGVMAYLDNHNIKYIPQYSFDDLRGIGGKPLSYDFYLSDKNILIEFQGIQHNAVSRFVGQTKEQAEISFIKQQEHDKRKKEYAIKHNIGLVEIWYYDFNNIDSILDNKLYITQQND